MVTLPKEEGRGLPYRRKEKDDELGKRDDRRTLSEKKSEQRNWSITRKLDSFHSLSYWVVDFANRCSQCTRADRLCEDTVPPDEWIPRCLAACNRNLSQLCNAKWYRPQSACAPPPGPSLTMISIPYRMLPQPDRISISRPLFPLFFVWTSIIFTVNPFGFTAVSLYRAILLFSHSVSFDGPASLYSKVRIHGSYILPR